MSLSIDAMSVVESSKEYQIKTSSRYHYNKLVAFVKSFAKDCQNSFPPSETTLFESTEEAECLRAALLGRPLNEPTSNKDLLFGRLFFDLYDIPNAVGLIDNLSCILINSTTQNDISKYNRHLKIADYSIKRNNIRKRTAKFLHDAVRVLSRDILPQWAEESDGSTILPKKKNRRICLLEEFLDRDPNVSVLHQMFGISRDLSSLNRLILSHVKRIMVVKRSVEIAYERLLNSKPGTASIITTGDASVAYQEVFQIHSASMEQVNAKELTIAIQTFYKEISLILHSCSDKKRYMNTLFGRYDTENQILRQGAATTDCYGTGSNLDYLDLKYTSSQNIVARDNSRGKMTSPDRSSHELLGSVISINQFGSPSFMAHLLEQVNQLCFTKGVGGRQGSYIRVSSQTTPPCPFLISNTLYDSKSTTSYEDELIQTVNNIMSVYNDNVEKATGRENPSPVVVNMIQMVVGGLQSCGYGSHNDTSSLVCCADPMNLEPFEKMADGTRLPTAAEMVVFTINFTLHNHSQLGTHNVVWHIPDDSSTSGILGKITSTGNFAHIQGGLVQQYSHHCVKQATDSPVPLRGAISFRMTGNDKAVLGSAEMITRRASLPLGKYAKKLGPIIPSSSYKTRNVVRLLANGGEANNDGSSSDGSSSDRSISDDDRQDSHISRRDRRTNQPLCYATGTNKKRKARTGTTKQSIRKHHLPMSVPPDSEAAVVINNHKPVWKQLCYDTWLEYGICRGHTTLGCRGPAWEHLSRAEGTRCLVIHHNCLLSVVHQYYLQSTLSDKTKEVDNQASFRTDVLFRPFRLDGRIQLFIPGEQYDAKYISDLSHIPHNQYSKPVVRTNSLRANVVIITQAYKNDVTTVLGSLHAIGTHWKLYREKFSKANHGGDIGQEARQKLPDVVIYGSGGAPTKGEEQPKMLADMTKNAITSYEPTDQSHHNAVNKCLQDIALRDSPLALFSLDNTFGSSTNQVENKNETNQVTFHGYFHISSYEYKKSNDEEGTVNLIDEKQMEIYTKIVNSPDYVRNIGMKECKHFSFTLKQIFDFNEWTTIDDCNKRDQWSLYDTVEHYVRGQQTVKKSFPFGVRIIPPTNNKNDISFVDPMNRAGNVLSQIVGAESNLWESYMLPIRICNAKRNYSEFNDHQAGNESEDLSTDWGIVIASTRELSLIGLLAFHAGASRYLGNSLTSFEGIEVATPLPITKDLPSVLRGQPLPMTNRCFDATPLLLWTCSVAIAGNREAVVCTTGTEPKVQVGERIDLSHLDSADKIGTHIDEKVQNAGCYLNTIFLQATILRITGQPSTFEAYFHSLATDDTSSPLPWKKWCVVPNEEALASFFDYMKNSTRIGQWISPQHRDSIPRILRGNMNAMIDFITNIASLIPGYCKEILDNNGLLGTVGIIDRRKDCISRYCALLATTLADVKARYGIANTDESNNLMFISSQILSDVEEVVVSPFGDCTAESVHLGFGSSQMIRCYKPPNSSVVNIDQNQLLRTLLDDMQMLAQDNYEWCTAMGWKCLMTDTGSKTVVSIWNGRPINAVDAEHLLCKAYITIVRTTGSRAITLQPIASRSDCHPIRWAHGPLWSHKLVEAIMLNATNAFMEIPIEQRKPPGVCLMTDEMDNAAVVEKSSVEDSSSSSTCQANMDESQDGMD